jgi:hypothetical protein
LNSSPTGCSLAKKYFVINPFTKSLKDIGSIWVGYEGLFTLLEHVNVRKYEWDVLKHICRKQKSNYFICSSIDNIWRRKTIPYGGTTPSASTKVKFVGCIWTKIMMTTLDMGTLYIGWLF